MFYYPVLPTVLVNGSEGIGTGWSTSIPAYNPLDLIKWVKNRLEKKEETNLMPWSRGFSGRIEKG